VEAREEEGERHLVLLPLSPGGCGGNAAAAALERGRLHARSWTGSEVKRVRRGWESRRDRIKLCERGDETEGLRSGF
jgi:hypothetical protein